jgi:hypothetical protein
VSTCLCEFLVGLLAPLVPVCGPAQTQTFFKLLFVKLPANGQQLTFQPGNPPLLDGPLPSSCRGKLGGHQEHGPLNRGMPNRGRERGPVGDRRVGQSRAPPGRGGYRWFAERILGIGHTHGGTPLDLDLSRLCWRSCLDPPPAVQGGGTLQPYSGLPGMVLPLLTKPAGLLLDTFELVRHDALFTVQQLGAVTRRLQTALHPHSSRTPGVAHCWPELSGR